VTPEEIASLDDGIRGLVLELNALGYRTTDSGDGTKAATMECAVDFPMVVVQSARAEVLDATEDIGRRYPDWSVQGTWQDGMAFIIMTQGMAE
jgi:hypothetical protein